MRGLLKDEKEGLYSGQYAFAAMPIGQDGSRGSWTQLKGVYLSDFWAVVSWSPPHFFHQPLQLPIVSS